jgi:hypothetical protein
MLAVRYRGAALGGHKEPVLPLPTDPDRSFVLPTGTWGW